MSIKISVDYDSRVETTREADSGDEWDRGDTHTDYNVHGVSIGDDNHWDCFCDVDVEVGDTIYLLYGIYSSGDSFGHDSQSGIEFIKCFKDRDFALNWLKTLDDLKKPKSYDGYSIMMPKENGEEEKYYTGWMWDYFGGIDEIHLEEYVLTNNKR